MHQALLRILADRYNAIKIQFPGEGRRRWHLRVLEGFWAIVLNDENSHTLNDKSIVPPSEDAFTQDDDPFDSFLEGPELGLLLRTNFSNEDAWQSFCNKLDVAEEEFTEAMKPEGQQDATECSPDSDDEGSLDGIPSPIIKTINPSYPMQTMFTNMSNLTALRLFNDVDIRLAPAPLPGQKRIQSPNRLIDQGKWQEIYGGMNIWIYDAQSNIDQCVRLVSQEGDVYGTATGDSWRVQGAHICEIQFNMSCLGMAINFGGLDKWDFHERRRNLEQAGLGIQ